MPRWKSKTIAMPAYYNRLKDIRIALGLEIKQMADIAGVPEVTYLTNEQGAVIEVPMDMLIAFAKKLSVSIDFLMALLIFLRHMQHLLICRTRLIQLEFVRFVWIKVLPGELWQNS